MYPLACRFAFRFPDDRAPEGRWHRIWPWFFSVQGVFAALMLTSWMKIGETGWIAIVALGAVAILAVSTRKYQGAGRVARRQMKWVVFGAYCCVLPLGLAAALSAFDPRFGWLFFASFWVAPLLPLSLVVSVLRYNLFDVDRLISGTASYSVLVALLALGGEVLFEPLAARAASSVGLDPGSGQVAFVVLLAAVLVPAQRAWRPYVDRIFFAEGRSVEASVEEALVEISHAISVASVMQGTEDGIERAFHPEFCVIYQRAGEVFEATYAVGAREAPRIPADNQGVLMLETKVAPIRLDSRGATLTSAKWIDSPVQGAAVIVPLRSQGALDTFVAIGPKRSGDVYTSTDLTLLSAMAHAVSAQLERGVPHEGA
jgi:hypothetical protein